MQLELNNSTLRPWKPSDAESLAKHANDYEIWKNLRDAFPHPYTLSHAESFIKEIAPFNKYAHAIQVDGKAVGSIGGKPQDDVNACCIEVGYWLGRVYWGRGIISEALAAFSDALLENGEFIRVYALPYATNFGSARVLEKAGFSLESVMKRSSIKEGQVLDQNVYVKLSSL